MQERPQNNEAMCETSEKGERLIRRQDMVPIALQIGRRILEVFSYQRIQNIVFRLKTDGRELHSVIEGRRLPSTELLLCINKVTGVSIDWLLTGNGMKYPPVIPVREMREPARLDLLSTLSNVDPRRLSFRNASSSQELMAEIVNG